MKRRARTAAVLACLLCGVACSAACSKGRAGAEQGADAAPVYVSPDPGVEALWARAKGGDAGSDPDDLARLADREGASGLVARAAVDPTMRGVALRAMAFAPDPGVFEGLPLLAEAAAGSNDADADAALDSAIDLAARPRLALDPDDALELKKGCDGLLALATDAKSARARRVKAIRALRMLVDRGCVDPKAIPAELDAR